MAKFRRQLQKETAIWILQVCCCDQVKEITTNSGTETRCEHTQCKFVGMHTVNNSKIYIKCAAFIAPGLGQIPLLPPSRRCSSANMNQTWYVLPCLIQLGQYLHVTIIHIRCTGNNNRLAKLNEDVFDKSSEHFFDLSNTALVCEKQRWHKYRNTQHQNTRTMQQSTCDEIRLHL